METENQLIECDVVASFVAMNTSHNRYQDVSMYTMLDKEHDMFGCCKVNEDGDKNVRIILGTD